MEGLREFLASKLAGSWQGEWLHLADYKIWLESQEGTASFSLFTIFLEHRGSGLGRSVIMLCREYADKTSKTMFLEEIENPEFFRSFDFIGNWEDIAPGKFRASYLPKSASQPGGSPGQGDAVRRLSWLSWRRP